MFKFGALLTLVFIVFKVLDMVQFGWFMVFLPLIIAFLIDVFLLFILGILKAIQENKGRF